MLPKRKYVKSYIGMGVALKTYGQEKVIKLKIKSVLTTEDDDGRTVMGVELEGFEAQKYRLRACNSNCCFELKGIKYVDPLFVYRNRKEVIQSYDSERIDELTRRRKELTERMSAVQKQYDYFLNDLSDCNQKLDEIMKVYKNRKWNLKKNKDSLNQDNN